MAIGTPQSLVQGIELVHGSVLPKPELVGDYTLIEDYKTNARLVIVGHYHSGYDLIVDNGTTYLCPGSIVRTQAQKGEMIRRPRVAIVSDEYEIEWLELESALPGEEVLEPPVVTPKLDFAETIREWSSIKIEDADVPTLIKQVAKQDETEEEVVEYALSLLEE
jgi:exonuclease SbcD